ncbi:MAG TPA: phosphotransferase [Polyangiaceae bacterium]|nr:phosphotransferase [Polyangiaceae bacterium]
MRRWPSTGEGYQGHAQRVAKSIVVKWVRPPDERTLARDPAALRSHRRKLRSYAVEAAFYTRHSRRCDQTCRVPQAYVIENGERDWLFVLENLDAAGYAARRTHASGADIRDALSWLAGFHARFLGVEPEGVWKRGSYWHLETRQDEWRALTDARVKEAASKIDERLARARFKTLIHGDAKLENFCFATGGVRPVQDGDSAARIAAVDFQYVGGGVGVQDVAYLLSSCLEGRELEAQAEQWLEFYLGELCRSAGQLRSTVGPLFSRAPVDEAALSEAVEEWRALYPFAVADFQRFLLGWAPSHARDSYLIEVTERVLAAVQR